MKAVFLLLCILPHFLLSQVEEAPAEVPGVPLVSMFSIGGTSYGNLVSIYNQNNYGHNELSYDAYWGVSIGVQGGISLNAQSQLFTGVLYSSAGQSYTDKIGNLENGKVVSLSYVHIPLVYKINLGKALGKLNTAQVYSFVGLQTGVLADANIDWKINGESTSMRHFVTQNPTGNRPNPRTDELDALLKGQDEPDSYLDLYQSFDLQLLFGGGVRASISPLMKIEIELRGGWGLVDINAENWRLENRNDVYEKSVNIFSGLGINLLYSL